MGAVDDIMNEMKEEASPTGPLPWRSPDYKPTPEAIKAFQNPGSDPGSNPEEGDEDSGQQPII